MYVALLKCYIIILIRVRNWFGSVERESLQQFLIGNLTFV